MEQFGSDDFPIEGLFNIVLSSNEDLHKETENLSIRDGTTDEIVDFAKEKGFKNLLIIGGENTNGQFLKAGLIDEIVLSVHPLVIGNGLTLFGKSDFDVSLQLLGTKKIDNELVQLRYKVLRDKND
ncbi:dihydrofolate reductase family protein [Candidatus Nomurabacteria bacterium]|nr:dihydrofolate reductase family protein [Candidatus Nomurabacteria bacterium]MCB9827061.1 dihydrofolate reductase family protein [Candidatus Nomurabacteria bacterium]MCB9827897.1 dihydrofolate reductase family protein [Candidatus Nomurabacteria bacterium]